MDEKSFNSYDSGRLNTYEKEADGIIENLKKEEKFRKEFFQGTNPKRCNIARLRSKIIKDIRESYHVIVSNETFNEIVFLTLWCGGSWETLETYNKQCTFFAWLRKVAKNAVMERLEEEHWISESRARTVGNTRLTLLSQAVDKCKLIIDELMVGTQYYDMLTCIYVERLSKTDIIKKMSIEGNDYDKLKKKAECKLRDALLRSDFFFEKDVLHDKSGRFVTVSSEFVTDMAEWCKAKMGVNPLSDVFGTNLSGEEIRQKVVEFLYEFSAKLNWSEEDRFIWHQRFMENAAPVDVAKKVGRSRGWLDTRYSRLNKKFEKAIKKWWHSHVL